MTPIGHHHATAGQAHGHAIFAGDVAIDTSITCIVRHVVAI
jgi:hypothetical protein